VKELLRERRKSRGRARPEEIGEVVEFRAPITLDCTGKESFTAVRNGWRIKDPYLNKVAVWTYYKGSKREPGLDEGQTAVAYVPEKGWFWHIPQHNDMVSVGVVAEGKYLTRDGVRDRSRSSNARSNRTSGSRTTSPVGAARADIHVTSEYSYHSRHCGCEGLLLVGDAFAFLDPVFSSGLMLALKSGVMAAMKCIALVEKDFSPNALKPTPLHAPRHRKHAQAGLCVLRPELLVQTGD
jgi:flavin-dependent dehydrogenase